MATARTEIIADILRDWGQEQVDNARSILQAKNAIASSQLLQSIRTIDTTSSPNVISIGITAEDYYTFVDEGVRGIGGGKKPKQSTGKYSFKNAFVGKRMKDAIADWITNKGIQVRTSKAQSKVSVLQQRDRLAFVIARSIKKNGLEQTKFWSDTFTEDAYKDLADRIAKGLGGEFTIQFRGI